MKDLVTPEVGKTCPALSKENYDYKLSGDATEHCICVLNNQPCIGRKIVDPDDQSSRFFSRAKCMISKKEIEKCPVYGCSVGTFKKILQEKNENKITDVS